MSGDSTDVNATQTNTRYDEQKNTLFFKCTLKNPMNISILPKTVVLYEGFGARARTLTWRINTLDTCTSRIIYDVMSDC
jgi:hypothetical protein